MADTRGSNDAERRKNRKLKEKKQEDELQEGIICAEKALANHQFVEATDLGADVLHKTLELYDKSSMKIVPCYLLLAESNLGIKRFKQTQEFLSLANWNIVKSGEVFDAIQSRTHRILAMLHDVQQRYDQSIREFSKSVYHSSLHSGPEHIDASRGYYGLGTVFRKMGRNEQALAVYDKIVDIWYKHLAGSKSHDEDLTDTETIQHTIAAEMFRHIIDMRMRSLGQMHIATGEAKYTLGLLYLHMGMKKEAHEEICAAFEVYTEQLGVSHPSTQDVRTVLNQLNVNSYD